MMSQHIEFEELVGFIYCQALDDNSFKLAAKVNSHLLQCEKCFSQYKILLALRDEVQSRIEENAIDPNKRMSLLHSLLEYGTHNPGIAARIDAWVNRMGKYSAAFSIKVNNYRELILLSAERVGAPYFDFGYAIPVGTRTAGAKTINRDVLVDDENSHNRILLQRGSLRIELDPEDFKNINSLCAIMDSENKIAFIKELRLDGDVLTAAFEQVPTGQYSVYIE